MPNTSDYTSSLIDPKIATILSGQTTSDAIDSCGSSAVMFTLPATFTGTEITFLVSRDNITYKQYRNIDNLPVSITCQQDYSYGVAAQDFFPVRYFKIVSNAAETGDREIIVDFKPI